MSVRCPKCGSEDVVLKAEIEVKFRFDEKGDVVVVTDVEDAIYWGVEYDGFPAECVCADCGFSFQYDKL